MLPTDNLFLSKRKSAAVRLALCTLMPAPRRRPITLCRVMPLGTASLATGANTTPPHARTTEVPAVSATWSSSASLSDPTRPGLVGHPSPDIAVCLPVAALPYDSSTVAKAKHRSLNLVHILQIVQRKLAPQPGSRSSRTPRHGQGVIGVRAASPSGAAEAEGDEFPLFRHRSSHGTPAGISGAAWFTQRSNSRRSTRQLPARARPWCMLPCQGICTMHPSDTCFDSVREPA
jgi:hypothetical protein